MKKSSGFTLIEVLLALVILAISLTALLKTTSQILSTTNRIKEKSIKHWVEMQAITKVQLGSLHIRSGQSTTETMKAFGSTWYYRVNSSPTKIKYLQKITVQASSNQTGPFTDPLVAFYHEE
ncbi:MAG: type II secretion system minor pseudopilin GspI [Legionellaceae bacterium]|nr:type II secretion system minor pseudopilin GspI [Legionellaceae bacterium]